MTWFHALTIKQIFKWAKEFLMNASVERIIFHYQNTVGCVKLKPGQNTFDVLSRNDSMGYMQAARHFTKTRIASEADSPRQFKKLNSFQIVIQHVLWSKYAAWFPTLTFSRCCLPESVFFSHGEVYVLWSASSYSDGVPICRCNITVR